MIDRRLQVLRVVHEYGTFAAASQVLHVTPSALSQQVSQLAHEVGVKLIEPQGRGIRLTEAGLALVRHADTLFAAWERAQAELAGLGNDTSAAGHVVMYGSATAVSGLIAAAVAQLNAEVPGLLVEVHQAEAADTANALLTHSADIGVVGATLETPPRTDPRFDFQTLLDDPYDLLVTAGHRLARRGRIALAEAAAEPWIVADPGPTQIDQLIMVACSAEGFTPHIAHRAQEWNAVAALVGHGLGVSLLPRLAPISAEFSVVRVPLAGNPAPSRRLLTCIRRGSRKHPAVAVTLDALGAVAANMTSNHLLSKCRRQSVS